MDVAVKVNQLVILIRESSTTLVLSFVMSVAPIVDAFFHSV